MLAGYLLDRKALWICWARSFAGRISQEPWKFLNACLCREKSDAYPLISFLAKLATAILLRILCKASLSQLTVIPEALGIYPDTPSFCSILDLSLPLAGSLN